MKAVFWLGIMVLMQILNISFKFKAVKNLSALLTYLCFGLFYKILRDFHLYWKTNSFLKGSVKFMETENFEDLVLRLLI